MVADSSLLSGGLAEGSASVCWTIRNQGSGTAKSWWYDRLYFSTNEVWETGDAQLDSFSESRVLAPGGSYGRTNTYTVPATPSSRAYLILRTDTSDGVFETAETNNTAVLSLGQAVPVPQLTIRWAPPKVELYWPTSAVGFVLQGTLALSASAVWTTPTNSVAISGTNFHSGSELAIFRVEQAIELARVGQG